MTEIVKGVAVYKPDLNFHGQDKTIALVELAGYQIKVVYFIKVQPEGFAGIPTDDSEVIKQFCGPKGRTWKISNPFPIFDVASLPPFQNAAGWPPLSSLSARIGVRSCIGT